MSNVKPPGKRVNRVTKNIGVVRAAGIAPPMPRGLCQQALQAWGDFWADVVSGAMRPSDTTIALRWVKNLDRYHRLIAEADRQPIVTGSTGQPRPNPLYDLCFKLEASIGTAERRMGIGPLDRLRLGLVLSETANSLADLNREITDTDNDDPRANLVRLADRLPGADLAPTDH